MFVSLCLYILQCFAVYLKSIGAQPSPRHTCAISINNKLRAHKLPNYGFTSPYPIQVTRTTDWTEYGVRRAEWVPTSATLPTDRQYWSSLRLEKACDTLISEHYDIVAYGYISKGFSPWKCKEVQFECFGTVDDMSKVRINLISICRLHRTSRFVGSCENHCQGRYAICRFSENTFS